MLDTKGAEIRTGDVEEEIPIRKGDEVVFAFKPVKDAKRTFIKVSYEKFTHDVKKAECIIVDNGTLIFDVVSIKGDVVTARSRDEGAIGSRRHINLPGADVSLPAMTESDWKDLEMGIEEGMDFIAASFIRTADEVKQIRSFIKKRKSSMQIIAKIESRQAVENIESIIEASDAIMVARGDLGSELPFESIPAIQDMIVERCREHGKPVIVATQMLESMIENPMPTRAEVTDVAHAAITRADSTMLSGETAKGEHPILAVQAMDRILTETESHQQPMPPMLEVHMGERSALAEAAISMAITLDAPAIAIHTRTGVTARIVSALRPGIPIIACAENEEIQRSLQLCHGVIPLVIPAKKDPESSVEMVLDVIQKSKLLPKKSTIVVIADTLSHRGEEAAVQIRTIN